MHRMIQNRRKVDRRFSGCKRAFHRYDMANLRPLATKNSQPVGLARHKSGRPQGGHRSFRIPRTRSQINRQRECDSIGDDRCGKGNDNRLVQGHITTVTYVGCRNNILRVPNRRRRNRRVRWRPGVPARILCSGWLPIGCRRGLPS